MSIVVSPAVRAAIVANTGFLVMVTIWGCLFPAIGRVLLTWDIFSATAGRHSGVSRVGVAIGAMYNNLIPVVAVLIALWAGRLPTAGQLAGGAVIIAGVLYAQVTALRSRATAQATAAEA